MEFLRKLFRRRPIDIAARELRKAEKQLLDAEYDLEMTIAAREVLIKRIDRLEKYIKTEGLERHHFDGNASQMAYRYFRTRESNSDFNTPYGDPLSQATKALASFTSNLAQSFKRNKNVV